MRDRTFHLERVGERAFEFEIMIYGDELTDRQPLLITNSIEFPMPPSQSFCEQMWEAGLQVIFVRRPGHGRSSPLPKPLLTKLNVESGATAMAEAVMLRTLIAKLDLDNIVLMAMGSSNPPCYRLIHMVREFSKVIFVNPSFNQDILPVFRPYWFQKMLKQVVTSESGLRVAKAGMKMLLRNDPLSFYQSILKTSPGDLAYVDANKSDYRAAAELELQITGGMLFYDAVMCLTEDPLLKDAYFAGVNASVLIGIDSSETWKRNMRKEADRLNLPLHYVSRADIFSAYASPEAVIALIRDEDSPYLLSSTDLADTA
ncbi:MAG: hypothetical protein AAGL11_01400 [Pseudomonadota bacterium]